MLGDYRFDILGEIAYSDGMFRGLLMLVFYSFIAYIILSVIRFFNSLGKSSKPSPATKLSSGVMVKDEICNTYLPKEDALIENYKGREYYFCSQECRQKFLESNSKWSS